MMKALMVMCAMAIFMMPALASWNHTIDYIEIDTKSQGDGFRIYVSLYDENDTTSIEEGTLVLEYLANEKDTTPIKKVTYQVNDTDVDEYTRYLSGEDFVAWKTERIPASDIPSSVMYVKATFIDRHGKKFTDTEYINNYL